MTVIFTSDTENQTVRASAAEAWKFRSFISYLTKRELRTTYLRSYLGWLWSLINPIAEIAIYSLVFGVILAGDRRLPDAPDDFSSFPHYSDLGHGDLEFLPRHVVEGSEQFCVDGEAPPEALFPARSRRRSPRP